jgi:hypothetical protein
MLCGKVADWTSPHESGTELPVVAAPRYPRSGTVHLGEPQCYAPMRAGSRSLGPMTWTAGRDEFPVSLVVADS